jgi:hypothetical protein
MPNLTINDYNRSEVTLHVSENELFLVSPVTHQRSASSE